MLQLTEAEKLRMTGIARIAELKETHFRNRKNVAQEAFDKSPAHLRKTICFHAGLKTPCEYAVFRVNSSRKRICC